MKLISWNIDSLNAALTAESPRALLSRAVIDTLVTEDADIIAIQRQNCQIRDRLKASRNFGKLLPGYANTWRSSVEPARKGYAGTLFLYKTI